MTTKALILLLVAAAIVLTFAWGVIVAVAWLGMRREHVQEMEEMDRRRAAMGVDVEDRIRRGARQTRERFKL